MHVEILMASPPFFFLGGNGFTLSTQINCQLYVSFRENMLKL